MIRLFCFILTKSEFGGYNTKDVSFACIVKTKNDLMSKEIDSYKLGNVQVVITETDRTDKLNVDCNDGTYHSEFTVRRYEYENYKRHMNQKITLAYNKQYGEE